jgi:hypothetical protein
MEGLKPGTRLAPGSLPHEDASEAVRFQIGAYPEIPAWPQLPQRSREERFGMRELSGMPALIRPQPDTPILDVDHPGFDEVAEMLRSENRDGPFDRGAFLHEEGAGFFAFLREAADIWGPELIGVKGQCAGPISLGLMVQDGFGKPILASREGMTALREHLLLHARWQIDKLARLGKPVFFFYDEPYLGSEFRPEEFGWTWDAIVGFLDGLIRPLQEVGVLVGVHSCSNGPWEWVTKTQAEMFHFDARYADRLEENAEAWEAYARQGGMLVWGVIPTHPAGVSLTGKETGDSGLGRYRWSERDLFSTACGLGGSTVSEAVEVVRRLDWFVKHLTQRRREK